jgi:hypothetical protein
MTPIVKWKIVKRFTSGLLEGITIEDISPVRMLVGFEYTPCVGSSKYVVESCEPEA